MELGQSPDLRSDRETKHRLCGFGNFRSNDICASGWWDLDYRSHVTWARTWCSGKPSIPRGISNNYIGTSNNYIVQNQIEDTGVISISCRDRKAPLSWRTPCVASERVISQECSGGTWSPVELKDWETGMGNLTRGLTSFAATVQDTDCQILLWISAHVCKV